MKTIHVRYAQARHRREKTRLLDEFCQTYGCHRKHALRLLNGPPPPAVRPARRTRRSSYALIRPLLAAVWEASGFLCGARLKPALAVWGPAIGRRFQPTPRQTQLLSAISPATIDRLLRPLKRDRRTRIYGTTRPGTLLKSHIPIKTDAWDVDRPGFTEVDLVSHSGDCAEGEFAHTLDLTDIHTAWVERRAVLGKHQVGVRDAVDDIRRALPFPLLGLDSDNGSEFINHHLWTYCQMAPRIQFTRGRPYKKDDNAHIEQKNWTHVRKLLGYARFETPAAVAALNDLYRHELRWFQNLFQPSVKLLHKVRVGARLRRRYDVAQTPLDRVLRAGHGDPTKLAALRRLREQLDPFTLAATIDRKIVRIWALRSKAPQPAWLRRAVHRPFAHALPEKAIILPDVRPPTERYERLVAKERVLETW